MKTKKQTRGGKRKGAGRPKGEPYTTISQSITVKRKEELYDKYGSKELTRLIKLYTETL